MILQEVVPVEVIEELGQMPMDTGLAAGAVLVLAGVSGAALLHWAFCTANAPRPLWLLREVALGLVAARVLATEVWGIEADRLRLVFWLALGVLTLALALHHLHRAAGRGGDRCP